MVKGASKNVGSEAKTRGEILKKRSIHKVFEHFEELFNAVFASTAVFRRLTDRLIPDDAVFLFIFKAWNPRIARLC